MKEARLREGGVFRSDMGLVQERDKPSLSLCSDLFVGAA